MESCLSYAQRKFDLYFGCRQARAAPTDDQTAVPNNRISRAPRASIPARPAASRMANAAAAGKSAGGPACSGALISNRAEPGCRRRSRTRRVAGPVDVPTRTRGMPGRRAGSGTPAADGPAADAKPRIPPRRPDRSQHAHCVKVTTIPDSRHLVRSRARQDGSSFPNLALGHSDGDAGPPGRERAGRRGFCAGLREAGLLVRLRPRSLGRSSCRIVTPASAGCS